ncbi:hypothetical protein QQF64_012993 [Cirrhinus molitorella]|uniref:Ig-like domain-containing protein n=1 Tax=Cirrhinus molitorella TaxID=172907 RepID=A0ABR3LPX4_9TELE
MFGLVLLFLFISISPQNNAKQEKHFLHYMYTVLTKAGPFPEFSAVCESDDTWIAHYSIEEQFWIRENLTVDDWNEAPEPPETSAWFLNYLHDHFKCKPHAECPEFNVLQRIIGCELEKFNGTVKSLKAFDEFAYDGRVFKTCKYEILPWMDNGIETKMDNQTGRMDFLMKCTQWISTFNNTYKSRPDVYVFARKAPDDQNKLHLTCLTTGFYPKHVEMNIRLDRTVLGKQIFSEIRPNGDGSFQLRSSVKIDRNHKGSYDCFVIHSSLTEPLSEEWERHHFYYRFTVLSKAYNFSDFTAEAVADDRRMSHYNTETEDWIRVNQIEYDGTEPLPEPYEPRDWYKDQLNILSNCTNSSDRKCFNCETAPWPVTVGILAAATVPDFALYINKESTALRKNCRDYGAVSQQIARSGAACADASDEELSADGSIDQTAV